MRKGLLVCLCLISVAGLMTLHGCDGTGSVNGGPVYEPEVDPGSVDPNCCGVSHEALVSGEAPEGGAYYWLALTYQDTIVTHGEPVYIEQGPFTDVTLKVSPCYLDNISAGRYDMQVFVTESEDDVGNVKRRMLVKTCGAVEIPSYMDSVCIDCCTNERNGGLYRYKALALKRIDSVTGAAAIIKTMYGRLCGSGTPTADTTNAQENCFACILEHTVRSGLPAQTQIGWMLQRRDGTVDTIVYWEVTSGGTTLLMAFDENTDIDVPLDSTYHRYEVYRGSDSSIYGYYDGERLDSVVVRSWAGLVMNYATWQGEINGRETDMPGTRDSPCDFWNCRTRVSYDESWNRVQFDNSSSTDTLLVTPQSGNRPNEWGIDYVPGTSDFWIWDENPY